MRPWRRSWRRQNTPWCWPTLWRTVIIPLSRQVERFLAPGGTFLCSGIIDTRAGEVAAALERNGLTVLERWERKGWVALAARMA